MNLVGIQHIIIPLRSKVRYYIIRHSASEADIGPKFPKISKMPMPEGVKSIS